MVLVRLSVKRYISMGVAVALMAAAAFILVAPNQVTGQVPDAIDLTGDVEASNCAPCHLRLGEASIPGLLFSHGNHLMVSCGACHVASPHESGKTYVPPMESCFNCHGISHGPIGELAASECSACHTPSFNLRPATHVANWAKKPHADRAKKDANQCILCHDSVQDCDTCHKALKLDVGPMPSVYLGILEKKPDKPSVNVFPNQPTSMGQCVYCHPDVDDFLPGRVIFAHADHLKRNYQCTVCHPQFGHGLESVRRPDMLSCYRCHGLTHARAGEIATEECYACHPKDFQLKPADHTKAFEAGKHKERANTSPEYCSMCHKSDFCVECHRGKKKISATQTSAVVIPKDHKNAKWMPDHGGLFLAQEGACGSCHDSRSCKRCHQTVMPHPADWLQDHTPEPGIGREDCNVCHTNRNSCQNCHHDAVKRSELTEANCVPCHEIMKQKPATKIQNKAFAEHAVHFDVVELKGKPYRCYECHVNFGNDTSHDTNLKQAAHDLRLCYECHGRLDHQSVLIAPYRGGELCVRCHTDLNLF